jgi:hypothetical protein
MPTIYYPQINGGTITQVPYKVTQSYSTSVVELPCGLRNTWGWRGMGLTNFPTGPLGKWEVNHAAITDAEVDTLRDFFVQMKGRFGQFTYLDPAGNLVPDSEDYSAASWTKQTLSAGSATTDPYGGNRAIPLTGGSGNSMLWCTLLPDGDASGLVLNASVWVKAASAGQSLLLAFIDSGFNILDSATRPVPQTWTRIDVSTTLASDSYIRLLIGGGSTWQAGQTIEVFGAQSVPMPGPGAYMKTPGGAGLHAKCRFDTDKFSPRYLGPNQIQLSLPIVEYF